MTITDQIFKIIGMLISGGATLYVIVLFFGFIGSTAINAIGRWYETAWIIVDWRLHKKEFKSWLKENVHASQRKTKYRNEKGELY